MASGDLPSGAARGVVGAACAWVYERVWRVVSGLLIVPREPPAMPSGAGLGGGGEVLRLKPGAAYLAYRKMWFWLGLTLIDVVIIGAWLVVCWRAPMAGAILALPALVVAFVPDILAYIAIHLSYDTTWYIITDRSMRLRSGVWTMHEMTLTFENVQNVEIMQGPVERHYGIATLKVETAGGSGGPGATGNGNNVGMLVGLENAAEVREWIMQRVRASRTSGLGDGPMLTAGPSGWSRGALEELRRIRNVVRIHS